MIPLVTERLVLRPWREEDKPPFAAINADAEVMRYFPSTLSRAESDERVERFNAAILDNGFSFFAAEEQITGRLIGTIGISRVSEPLPVAPAVEIGWRLAAEVWRRGYATEGARACLQFAFDELRLPEVIAMTAAGNVASRRVMEKIRMVRNAGQDFDHPMIEPGHPLRRHVVYRIKRGDWMPTAY